jgi:hypothetical protein
MDFVTLSCPSCGGKLQITSDIERFACSYCGIEHIVRRGGGIITLAPFVEGLKGVQIGVDKTASELAIQRLTREISELERYYSQLYDKRLKERAVFILFRDNNNINRLTKEMAIALEIAKQKKVEIQKHKKIIGS